MEQPVNSSADDATAAAPPPRAFAQGVGLLMQTVGVILFLSTCCVCSTSFLWDPIQTPDPNDIIEQQTPAQRVGAMFDKPGKAGLMLTIVSMTVGGLALASLGLGLQSDHRHAATASVIATATLVAVLATAGAGLWSGESAAGTRIWHAVLSAIMLAMLGFTVAAWREVRRNPPPTDVMTIPPGTKIPYSMYHDDPPEVRLANEIANRRARLDAERAELDRMERELRDKSDG